MHPVHFVLLLYMGIMFRRGTTCSLTGTITEDTKFIHKTLSSFPSKIVTIEYSISYRNGSFCTPRSQYCKADLHLLFNENSSVVRRNCSDEGFQQFFNVNLVVVLPSVKDVKQKPPTPAIDKQNNRICRIISQKENNSVVCCSGKVLVQDYKARYWAFAIAFRCSTSPLVQPKFKRLVYNVTLHSESNTSQCVGIPGRSGKMNCEAQYKYTSLPNLMGQSTINQIAGVIRDFNIAKTLVRTLVDESDLFLQCHQHTPAVFCHIVAPPCNPETREVTHLCRETCMEVLEA